MKSGVNTHVHQDLSEDQGTVRAQVPLGACTGLACKNSHPSVSMGDQFQDYRYQNE